MPLYAGKSRKEKLRWKAFEETGGDLANESFAHSGCYHSHFAGYAESRLPRENGRGSRIVRVYVAPYYSQDVSEAQWIRYKVVYAALYLAGVLAYLVGAVEPQAVSNSTAYVALPGLLSAFCLFVELVLVAKTVCQKRKMTVGAYRSGPARLAGWSAATSVLLAATAAAVLVCIAVNGLYTVAELRCLMMNLAAAGAFWLLHRLESDMSYKRIPNKNQPPSEDYVLIQ